jgi:hypothetical protein
MKKSVFSIKTLGSLSQGFFFYVFVLFCLPLSLSGQDEYTFRYFGQVEYQGKILNILSYRFFHEASASVRFQKTMDEKGLEDYRYLDIDGPGYVMTTGGLNGNSLYFFTADYDMDRAQRFQEARITSFLDELPSYAKTINKIRQRPMTILSQNPEDLQFKRSRAGIHLDSAVRLQLSDSHSQTYSNIYEILGVLLLAFNHSCLPPHDWDRAKSKSPFSWESDPLDFTSILEDFAALVSEGAKRHAHFKQENPFKLKYQLKESNEDSLIIVGEAYPGVKIRKDMNLNHVIRTVTLEKGDICEDKLVLDFRDEKGKGGHIVLEFMRVGKEQ